MYHGGNIYQFAKFISCLPEQVLDFSANINPDQAVSLDWMQDLHLGPYADPTYSALIKAIRHRYLIPPNVELELFNGASAAIFALLRHLQPEELVLYTPLYSEYRKIADQLGCNVHNINRFYSLMTSVPKRSVVIFVNPSTPDGQLYDLKELLQIWRASDCTIIIDESFLDFCRVDSVSSYIADYEKLYIIKSLSKFYGCAGIRVGYIMAAKAAIMALKGYEPTWKLSSFDMLYIQHALKNNNFIEQTRLQTEYLRNLQQHALQKSGLFEQIYMGQANFLLAKLAHNIDGYQLQELLASSRILIRVCDSFDGLNKRYVRFAVKKAQDIIQLADSLEVVALNIYSDSDFEFIGL